MFDAIARTRPVADRGCLWWTLLLVLVVGLLPVQAHKINTSYTTLIVHPDSLKLMVVIDEYDLRTSFDLDTNGDDMLWRDEMLAGVPAVFDYVEKKVALVVDGRPVVLERSKGDVQPDNKGNMFINLFFKAGLPEPPLEIEMEVDFCGEFEGDHKNLSKILLPGKPLRQAVFSAENPRQKFVVGARPGSFFDSLMKRVSSWFE